MFLFHTNNTQIPIESDSVLIEKNLCLINITEFNSDKIRFSKSDDESDQSCTILMLDQNEGEFIEHQVEVKIKECFDKPCLLDIDSKFKVMNGTSIVCEESAHIGIVIKSEFRIILMKLTGLNS